MQSYRLLEAQNDLAQRIVEVVDVLHIIGRDAMMIAIWMSVRDRSPWR